MERNRDGAGPRAPAGPPAWRRRLRYLSSPSPRWKLGHRPAFALAWRPAAAVKSALAVIQRAVGSASSDACGLLRRQAARPSLRRRRHVAALLGDIGGALPDVRDSNMTMYGLNSGKRGGMLTTSRTPVDSRDTGQLSRQRRQCLLRASEESDAESGWSWLQVRKASLGFARGVRRSCAAGVTASGEGL